MKKILAIILCLALLGSCAAFAEAVEKETIGTLNSANGSFNVKCKLPEGYQLYVLNSDDNTITAMITSSDANNAMITVSIAYNELYTAEDGTPMRLNDVSEEDLQLIKDSFTDVSDSAEFEDMETGLGTKVLAVRGTIGDSQYFDLYSIYNSYEIEAIVTASTEAEDKALSAEQQQMMLDFYTEMDFEEVK